MPFPKTEHEDEILKRTDAGEPLAQVARDLGVARNTVKAVLDRNNRKRGTHKSEYLNKRLARSILGFGRALLVYLNKQENTPERREIISRLGHLEATANRVLEDGVTAGQETP